MATDLRFARPLRLTTLTTLTSHKVLSATPAHYHRRPLSSPPIRITKDST